uniref:Uncharacterized protein n=1 Tax=Sphaerodactylus townsendi TaxID=933632 RepID=A0ACB8EI16_9SAUR
MVQLKAKIRDVGYFFPLLKTAMWAANFTGKEAEGKEEGGIGKDCIWEKLNEQKVTSLPNWGSRDLGRTLEVYKITQGTKIISLPSPKYCSSGSALGSPI